MVSGRAAEKSAASSSWASGLTGDHHGREGRRLRDTEEASLGQLEQREERGEQIDDRGTGTERVAPPDLFALEQQELDARRGALDVERPRDDAVQDGGRNPRDHLL